MSKVIVTRFLVKSQKMKALSSTGEKQTSYGSGTAEDHRRAAEGLARKLRWSGVWFYGELPKGEEYCFVQVNGLNYSYSDGDSFTITEFSEE